MAPLARKGVKKIKLGQDITRFFDKRKAEKDEQIKASQQQSVIDLTQEGAKPATGKPAAPARALGDRTNGNNNSRHLGMASHYHPPQQRPSKYPHLAPDAVVSCARAQPVAVPKPAAKAPGQASEAPQAAKLATAPGKQADAPSTAGHQKPEPSAVHKPAGADATMRKQGSGARRDSRSPSLVASTRPRLLPSKRPSSCDVTPLPSQSLSQDGDDGGGTVTYERTAVGSTASSHGRARAHKDRHKSGGGGQKWLLSAPAEPPPQPPGNDDSAMNHQRSSSSFQDALLEQLLALPSPAAKRSQEDGKDIKDLKGSVFRERAAEAQTPKLSRIQEHAVGTAIKGSRLKGSKSARKAVGTSTGKRRAKGKRKALLDALDQVENLMQHSGQQQGTNQQPSGASCSTTLNNNHLEPARPSLAPDDSQTLDLRPSLPAADESRPDESQPRKKGTGVLATPHAAECHLAALFDAADVPESRAQGKSTVRDAGGEPEVAQAQQPAEELAKLNLAEAVADQAAAQAMLREERHSSPNDAQAVQAPSALPPGAEYRYVVLEVQHDSCETVVRLLSLDGQRLVMTHLRDGWADTELAPGDSVNLLAEISHQEGGALTAVCDYKSGAIIVQPQWLVSGTRVAGSYKCLRQAVLEERCGGSPNGKATLGTLLHELVQAALLGTATDVPGLLEIGKGIAAANAEKLLEVGLTDAEVLAPFKDAAPRIAAWMATYAGPRPKPSAVASTGWHAGQEEPQALAVTDVVDIEEAIWAPMHGLKGMVDASVSAAVQPAGLCTKSADEATRKLPPPHLLGQLQHAALTPISRVGNQGHKAQVVLYQLLMEERYSSTVNQGILWNLQEARPELVSRSVGEVPALLSQRNRVAAALAKTMQLPGMLQDPRACSSCFQLSNCALHHKAVEQGNAETAEMGVAFDAETAHLTPAHCEFLCRWLHLLSLEEGSLPSKRAEIWQLSGQDRERRGGCLAGLALMSHQPPQEPKGAHRYAFTRPPHAGASGNGSAPTSLADCGFSQGEMVLLGLDGSHPAIARGHIVDITLTTLTLATKGVINAHVLRQGVSIQQHPSQPPRQGGVLNKDEVATVSVRMRQNLLGLCAKASPQAEQLRRLIIDLQTPDSSTADSAMSQQQLQELTPPGAPIQELNPQQQHAVRRIVDCRDYVLLLGMPGSGKTATIVAAVAAIVQQGGTVLLTSYTNSAVDNILLRLKAAGINFLRIGRPDSVHAALQTHLLGGDSFPDTVLTGLQRIQSTVRVVGCTTLSMGHALLKGQVFDMCLVDEAGQITLPASLGPLLQARAWCLVGDPYQLPPLVTNPQARAQGLSTSLFRRLSQAHPEAVVVLSLQYRMAASIQLLANTLVYNGQLRCGNEAVANARIEAMPAHAADGLSTWIVQALRPELQSVFLDTDSFMGGESAAGREEGTGSALVNAAEAEASMQLTEALLRGGVSQQGDIGIMSPYRSQVSLLERMTKQRGWASVEVSTIDRFQGRDKNVILLSLVRSNHARTAGRLLADWRRVNVALTRAKHKLVLIGSASTVASVPLWQQLLELMRNRGWVVEMK
ncbi:hypothetical protein WJX73_007951 [Symbiochloris irregularis]|uniref:DNA replication ATP-dependent helicase/nuclease n=1 Tax=Symbiochloris irregularis TaxID=706552 RepID=A0AAW1NSW7_9CHLO